MITGIRGKGSLVPGALVLSLLAAACGGGGSNKVSSSGTGTTSTTAATRDVAADQSLASRAVLTASDAPRGYRAQPHSSSGDIPEQVKRDFANCMDSEVTMFDDPPGTLKSDGPDLVNADEDAEIDNSVQILPSRADVNKQYEQLTSAGVENCLSRLFDAAIRQELQKSSDAAGVAFGKAAVDSFAISSVPDGGRGFQVTIPVTANGRSTNFYIDALLVKRGRAELTLTSQTVGTTPDRDVELALIKRMSERLGAQAP
jgi:hypothetical protein